MSKTFRELQAEAHRMAREKGWWDECVDTTNAIGGGTHKDGPLIETYVISGIPEKIALMHSELSEALEEYRRLPRTVEEAVEWLCVPRLDAKGKPESFATELADTVIRIMDQAGALGIDLQAVIEQKMAYNATRPHRHGGKRC